MSDVVTVTTGTVGNAGNVVADLQTYFAANLLEVAELRCVLNQHGEKVPIPSNSSKTIHFVKEEKFSSTVPSQLTEGAAPEAMGITLNQFEATAEQYGALVKITDLAELTAKHPIVQKTIYLLGLHAAEIYDQLIYAVIAAGTSVYRPNGRAADTNLIGSDHLSYNDLISILAKLQDNAARPLDGGAELREGALYSAIVCPQVHAALLKDPDFKAAAQFQAPSRIWNGQAEVLGGFRIVVSNSPSFAATATTASGVSNKVYSSFFLGQGAFQVSDLQNLRVYVTAPGGGSDPLYQKRQIGWKFAFKSIITNQNWLFVGRSSGLNSVTN
jgi:N4-gp56 family major capsid protein